MADKLIQLKDGTDNLFPATRVKTQDLSSLVSTTYSQNNSLYGYRFGEFTILYYNMNLNSTLPTNAETEVVVLPTDFRPITKYNIIVPMQGATSQGIVLQIYSGGSLTLYPTGTARGFIRGMLVYPS